MKHLNLKYILFALLCLLVFTASIISGFMGFKLYQNRYPKIGAYIRIKNEMHTLPTVLTSIDGFFDKIVIIHSNEADDGSNAYAKKWCDKQPICKIYEYPYAVIPSHDNRYKDAYKYENSLAAYYQFGLDKFEPEEWVMKIDADQVYIRPRLKEVLTQVRTTPNNDSFLYSVYGFNTLVWHNQLVKFTARPFNGKMLDNFIIKRKNITHFSQEEYWELAHYNKNLTTVNMPLPIWFHFMKSLKIVKKPERQNKTLEKEEVSFLTPDEKRLYQTYIAPLFEKGMTYSKITY